MLKSMTGFGRAAADADGVLWTVEVSSVNSRFLDVQVRLPRILAGAEFALRKRVNERLGRGKITVTVTWEILSEGTAGTVLNEPLAQAYIKQLKELQEHHGLAGDVSVAVVAGLPDLFSSAVESGDREAREARLLAVLDEALAALDRMRQSEGEQLRLDISGRLGMARDDVLAMEAEAAEYARALADRIQTRIRQLFADASLEPQRIAQEAVFLAERADITEERVRLAAHLDEFERLLQRGGEVGRRFSFLLQEMVRETNTIGSKTGELAVIQRVVRIKEELEKIREQVQNLE
jgi:uncharacterized protein (TIGR00255 family)